MSRTLAALHILDSAASVFTIQEYQCDPEQCGHADSIILRAPGHVGVCFSLDELREKAETLHNAIVQRSDLDYVTSVRTHFLGGERI